MNKELLNLIQPELTEKEIRELCRVKKEELGFDIEKAIFPVNPLLIDKPKISVDEAIKLVEKLASVGASVGASVRNSVGNIVVDSVGDSVVDSVWDSVVDSVWASVRNSVGASVGASVRNSVGNSVWVYISSIFYKIDDWKGIEHEKGVNPFQSEIDLWEAGYVASYDGKNWRLHIGKDAKIVWKGKFKNGKRN